MAPPPRLPGRTSSDVTPAVQRTGNGGSSQPSLPARRGSAGITGSAATAAATATSHARAQQHQQHGQQPPRRQSSGGEGGGSAVTPPARLPPSVPTTVIPGAAPAPRPYEPYLAPGAKAALAAANRGAGPAQLQPPPPQQQQQHRPTARRSTGGGGVVGSVAAGGMQRPVLRASARPQLQANRRPTQQQRARPTARGPPGRGGGGRGGGRAGGGASDGASAGGDDRSSLSNQARKVFREAQGIVRGQGPAHDRLQAAQLLALDVDQMCTLARGFASTAPASFAAAVDGFAGPCSRLKQARRAHDNAGVAAAAKEISGASRKLVDAVAALPK